MDDARGSAERAGVTAVERCSACKCADDFRTAVTAQTVAWLKAFAAMPAANRIGFTAAPLWGRLPAFSPTCYPLCDEAKVLLASHFRPEEPGLPRLVHPAPPHTEAHP